jgi:hypothetical protein
MFDYCAVKSVEELREEAADLAARESAFELWVPETLTLNGHAVRKDLAMAVLLDAILAFGFMPDGPTAGVGGATYRYRRG